MRKEMKYQAIIFDLDGTLLNTLEDLTDGINVAMNKFGLEEKTLEQIRSYVGNGIPKLVERCLDEGTNHPQYAEILSFFRNYYKEHCLIKTKLYDGITEMLAKLKEQGIPMAIVTNKAQNAAEELFEIFFKDTISLVVGQRDGQPVKPDPSPVLYALEELGVDKSQAIYVGDSDVDYQTAKNVGMDCALCTWGFRPEEMLRGFHPTALITHPMELLEVV